MWAALILILLLIALATGFSARPVMFFGAGWYGGGWFGLLFVIVVLLVLSHQIKGFDGLAAMR
jgi:hypothetical protein